MSFNLCFLFSLFFFIVAGRFEVISGVRLFTYFISIIDFWYQSVLIYRNSYFSFGGRRRCPGKSINNDNSMDVALCMNFQSGGFPHLPPTTCLIKHLLVIYCFSPKSFLVSVIQHQAPKRQYIYCGDTVDLHTCMDDLNSNSIQKHL